MQIQNSAVLITGASRGLGEALARALARKGARVVLASRDIEELAQVVAAIRTRGGEAHALAADIGDQHAIYPLIGAAAALVGPIDIVVNNASTLGALPLRELLETDCEDIERVLQVNLLGPFRVTKAVAGSMVLRGHGLIVNVTSDAAVVGYPTWGAYGVSKAALEQLGRIWAAELNQSGVRFLTVDPGEMDTRMHADAVPEADRSALAEPMAVARGLVRLIESADSHPSGARIAIAPVPSDDPSDAAAIEEVLR